MAVTSTPWRNRVCTFVPADPPRASTFVFWDEAEPGGLTAGAPPEGLTEVDIELVLPAARGTTLSPVRGWSMDMATAIDELAVIGLADDAHPSVHAWSSIVRTALSYIADGRVLPWVSPSGRDTWRVDPLDAGDDLIVANLAAALPATAHAIPRGRGRIADPVHHVRAAFDAIADRFIRTAAAHRVEGLSLFADPRPTTVEHLRPWVGDIARSRCANSRFVVCVHPPAGGDEEDDNPWRLVFQLQSTRDPSLIIDVADWHRAPDEVAARLGDEAESVMVAGLQTLATNVAGLEHVLDIDRPSEADLADADLDDFLDQLDVLELERVDVRWPAQLVAPRIERKLVVDTMAGDQGGVGTIGDLESLLTVNWEFLLDGLALTAEELTVLGEAKRGVVPLRGRWVRLDRRARQMLTAPPPAISPTEALAASLGSPLEGAEDEFGEAEVEIRGGLHDFAGMIGEVGRDREMAEPAALHAELRPYQRRGLAWMNDLVSVGLGGCLADDMGLGKTIQVLALHVSRPGQTLVVCPTSLLGNWAREAAKFIPDTPVRTFHGPTRSLDDLAPNEIVLTTYGVVRSDTETLGAHRFDLVVADEAQHAKNPRSRTAKAIRELNGTARIAMSGTPVENRLLELWSILDWAVPGLLGPLDRFRRTVAQPIEKDDDREAAFRLRQLIAPFVLRRTKQDPGIAPDLPEKLERDVVVPLSEEQVTLYKATVSEAMAEVQKASGIERRGLVLKMLTGLKQITNHPAHYLGEDGPLAARSGKLTQLEQLVADVVDGGEAMLVFTQYVAMGELLVQHLAGAGHRAAMLHGGQSVGARQRLVDDFQDGAIDVLVLSLKAGGTGLNLTRATHVVHYDRWWNPAVEDQATDRAYRIGQTRCVTVHRIITEGTVEDRVATLLERKRKLADRVMAGGEGWISELDDDDLADLVRLDRSSSAVAVG